MWLQLTDVQHSETPTLVPTLPSITCDHEDQDHDPHGTTDSANAENKQSEKSDCFPDSNADDAIAAVIEDMKGLRKSRCLSIKSPPQKTKPSKQTNQKSKEWDLRNFDEIPAVHK